MKICMVQTLTDPIFTQSNFLKARSGSVLYSGKYTLLCNSSCLPSSPRSVFLALLANQVGDSQEKYPTAEVVFQNRGWLRALRRKSIKSSKPHLAVVVYLHFIQLKRKYIGRVPI